MLYLLLNKQFTSEAQLYLAKRDDLYQPLNEFITQRISLQNSTDPATPEAMLKLLQTAAVFINSNDLFYENELMQRCLRNIIDGKDKSLYAKATDEAYQVLRKIYGAVLREGCFNSYFMKSMANALEPDINRDKSQQGPQRPVDPKKLPAVFKANLGPVHLRGEDKSFLTEEAQKRDHTVFIKRFFQCVASQLFEFDAKGVTQGDFQHKIVKLEGMGIKQLRQGMNHWGPVEFKLELFKVLFGKIEWDLFEKMDVAGAESCRTLIGERMELIEVHTYILNLLKPYIQAGEVKAASPTLASALSSASELYRYVYNLLEQILRDPSIANRGEYDRLEKNCKELIRVINTEQAAAQEDAKKEKAAQPPDVSKIPDSKGVTDLKDPPPAKKATVPGNANAGAADPQPAAQNRFTKKGA